MSRFILKDHYTERAKREGFSARSAFKLQEIHQRLGLIKQGSIVLDLGCAPGSWLQLVEKIIGKKGAALGVDLSEVTQTFAKNIRCVKDDCFLLSPEKIAEYMAPLVDNFSHFDVVLSDMAPKTSGIKHLDQIKSLELSSSALEIATQFLRPGGHVVIKVFSGGDVGELISAAKKLFKQVKQMRPKSIRVTSKEFYVVGINKI